MLEKWIVRKFTLDDCKEVRERTEADLALTSIRLSKLKNTQAKNPGWAAYDEYADDIVGIDIRIEEQSAVAEELLEDLLLLADRERVITIAAAYTGRSPAPHQQAIQLGFFDTAKRRERIGAPC